ncbi:MAG TPA: Lpg1974 family pore-forming outer membrane protein [Rhabdochlamydiaceae bacterium]|nr:Lpg1974 family pore-forming outer membrane protein [Rhabdochlamydiaceae bacterium]
MKNQSAFTLFALFTAFPVISHASNKSDIQELKQRVQCLEERKTCCTQTQCSACTCDTDIKTTFYVSGEALYWKTSETGLAYVTKVANESATPSQQLEGGRTKHPSFDWHWGFRVGAGYKMCHDLWDIYANWTRFHFANRDKTDLGPFRSPVAVSLPTLFPFWLPNAGAFTTLPEAVNSAEARWKVHLDVIDLELAREFFVTDWLTFRPHLGFRTAWINQKLDLEYSAFSSPVTTSTERAFSVDMKNNFWGIGIIAGLDTNWILGCGFSIYGNVAFSILDGHFKTTFDYSGQFFNAGGVGSARNIFEDKNHQNFATFVADLAIGLDWRRNISCDRFYLGAWAGYEQHIFFEQSQFMNYQSSVFVPNFYTDGGNLNMTGITIGFEFGF